VEKAPALAEPWGGPGTECNVCHDAKVTCMWPSGITKRTWSCDRCQGRKASCKIGGAPDLRSWGLKPKPVQQGKGASEDHPAKRCWMDAEVEVGGSSVSSSGATTGVGSGGVATRVGGGGNTTEAEATREPSANTR
jgi:hypothetical protein